MLMLSDIIALVIFYGIGWIGAFMLLITCSYIFSTIYHELKLEVLANVNTSWRSFVSDVYNWLNLDFYTESVFDYYLSFEVTVLMAILACLGPLLFIPALIIMFIAWVIIYLWTSLR